MAQKRKRLHLAHLSDDVGMKKSKLDTNPTGTAAPKEPSLYYSTSHRPDGFVKIKDLQQLVLYLLTDEDDTPPAPRWIAARNLRLFERVVVLHVSGFTRDLFFHDESSGISSSKTGGHKNSPDDYYPRPFDADQAPKGLSALAQIFPHVWPVRAAGDTRYAKFISPVYTMLSCSVPKYEKSKSRSSNGKKRTSITQFIASEAELESNAYVLHPTYFDDPPSLPPGWVSSRVKSLDDANDAEINAESGSITCGRKVISIDCEMCSTGDHELGLTRISVLDWDDETVLDELVKPDKPIIDYLTQFSGITEAMLQNVTTTLADIQQKLLDIVTPTTIIVGHSLESDFQALKFTHPFIVDTSLIFPHPKGAPYKQSLKFITKQHLKRDIQQQHGVGGHDSVEDARAVMDLVRQKCEMGPDFGVPDMSEPIVQRLSRDSIIGDEFCSCVVDWKAARNAYVALADVPIECTNDAEVVESIKRVMRTAGSGEVQEMNELNESSASTTDVTHSKTPTFLWASLHSVEHARGWFRTSEAQFNTPQRGGKLNDASPIYASEADLDAAVLETTERIASIYEALPPRTAFILYSGLDDTTEVKRYAQMHKQFQDEFKTKKWDELSVQWTAVEDDAKRAAFRKAIGGIGMVTVKN
jgi:RNA exonuclease 1